MVQLTSADHPAPFEVWNTFLASIFRTGALIAKSNGRRHAMVLLKSFDT
jgi:hypothetical protein